MSNGVVEKSPSSDLGSHNGPRHTQWLAENLEEVDQSVKAMLNLIEDGVFSHGQNDEIYEKKPLLISHVEGLHRMFRSLAERYNHLTKEVHEERKNTVVYHSLSSQNSLLVTPNQKEGLNKPENNVAGLNLSPSSGNGNSDFSDKGGSEISSSTSDSESEAFYSVANKTSHLHVNLPENESYTTLLRRVTKYEEEMKESDRKLCSSGDEIAKLKEEIEKLRGISELVNKLQDELEIAQREIIMQETNLETEKRLVLELKEKIIGHEADAYEREHEIKKINIALFDAQRISSLEKAKLNCDILKMSEQLTLTKARSEESEMRNEFLENEIKKCVVEKVNMESMYKDERIRWFGEIGKLKADVSDRGEVVEVLNKNFDELKLKYDMLVAEKDGLNAKFQTLNAEMLSQRNVILQLEMNLARETYDCMDVKGRFDHTNKLVDELSVRVIELEREVEKQRVVISDRCEEKREAIRQLCFSIELYRNNYQELKKAVAGHRRTSVLAY